MDAAQAVRQWREGSTDFEILILGGDERAAAGDTFLKAQLVEEAGQRHVYFEASNPSWDLQHQKITVAALMKSAPYYLSRGNIDIEHKSLLGDLMKPPLINSRQYEIGRPLEVKAEGDKRVVVKGVIYKSANGDMLGDWFWKSQTELTPAMPYFASVAGIIEKTQVRKVFDPESGQHRLVITDTYWINTGFAREPINRTVPAVSIVPFGLFAKGISLALTAPDCCGDGGPECECFAKALTAAGGSDPATLHGGAAVRLQSLDGAPRWRAHAAKFVRDLPAGKCPHTGPKAALSRASLIEHFTQCEGLDQAEATQTAARLLAATAKQLKRHAPAIAAAA